MNLIKNKIFFVITIFAALIFTLGIVFVHALSAILVSNVQNSLQNISQQGSLALHTAVLGNMDMLEAMAGMDAFTKKEPDAGFLHALEAEAGKKGFDLVAFTDLAGNAVPCHGPSLYVGDREFFRKACRGIPNVAFDHVRASENEKEVVYAVPVRRGGSVSGVLIAAAPGIAQFGGMECVTSAGESPFTVLKSDGTIIISQLVPKNGVNFFSMLGAGDGERLQSEIRKNQSGHSTIEMNDITMQAAYSTIKDTDGWVFLIAANSGLIFGQTNRVLMLTFLLFAVVLAAFLIAFFCFFKLKRISYEAKIRNDEQKRYFVYTDSLTNLPNRKGMKKQFEAWAEECRKCGKNGGAFFLDVDNFRSVNNTFSHDTGDRFLCETAARLRRTLGSRAILGRIGGDEFSVLVNGLNTVDELEFFANKILVVFKEPYLINGIVIQLTCSLGAILYRFDETGSGTNFNEILNRGEFVLNEAKHSQKGGYVLYNEEWGGRIDHQLALESALKYSIENNELLCYFQPQYDCTRNTIVGFETLARWKSTRYGMVSPAEFIPMAEKSGFIRELGRFIMEKAFAFAKSMQGRGLVISFNASPVELLQANFTDCIISRFDSYGLAPGSVAVEVTESCLIESFEEVTRKLRELHDHGIQVHLDDFGTGFSSLTYLKDLPINAVKIDKSFVDEIVTNSVEKDIVNMIIMLAHRLNLSVIAEGVENEQQIRYILECGCNIVQGYYISRPVPQNEVLPLLQVLNSRGKA